MIDRYLIVAGIYMCMNRKVSKEKRCTIDSNMGAPNNKEVGGGSSSLPLGFSCSS
jgi:hypothetical protein